MIVTSFSQRGYHEYGRRFIESFLKHCSDQDLYVYYERKLPKNRPENSRVHYINLYDFKDFVHLTKIFKTSDPLFSGLMRGKDSKKVYNFRYDANRFFRKVCAITMHAFDHPPHTFAWCDADVIFHEDLPLDFLKTLMPNEKDFIAALLRPHSYTETGFIVFDTSHPLSDEFMRNYWRTYSNGAFKYLGEWHDCYVFDFICAMMEVPILDLTEGKETDHPFIHSVLGKYMDHMKGPERKKAGRSSPKENIAKHEGSHWEIPVEAEAKQA